MKKVFLIVIIVSSFFTSFSQNLHKHYFLLKPSITDTLIYKPTMGFNLTNNDFRLFRQYNLINTSVYDARSSIYGSSCIYVNSFNLNNSYKGMDYYYYNIKQNNFWGDLVRDIVISMMKY